VVGCSKARGRPCLTACQSTDKSATGDDPELARQPSGRGPLTRRGTLAVHVVGRFPSLILVTQSKNPAGGLLGVHGPPLSTGVVVARRGVAEQVQAPVLDLGALASMSPPARCGCCRPAGIRRVAGLKPRRDGP
jgi:hypothetical protein